MNVELECKAFAENYIAKGRSLEYLKIEQSEDGTLSYQPDWNALEEAGIDDFEHTNDLAEHAEYVTICLRAWLDCAKTKAVPKGYVLMPKEVSQELIEHEMQGKVLPAVVGSYERAVESFKHRYKSMLEKQEEINQKTAFAEV